MKKFFREKNYAKWGLTAFIVIVVALLCNQLLSKWKYAMDFVDLVVKALRPVIIGAIFAYVLNPLLKVYEKYLFEKPFKKLFKNNDKMAFKCKRIASIFLTFVTALTVVGGLLLLIVPELFDNIRRLVMNLEMYIENANAFFTTFAEENPEISGSVMQYADVLYKYMIDWITNTALPNANVFVTNVSKYIVDTFRIVLDVLIGMIVAVYLLFAKEKYAAGIKKYLHAIFKKETATKVIALMKYTDNHFGGFLVGKIVDSAIIGVLSFIIFTIFDIPYTLVVSVIVGVTNVIPFFGPFLGAIPAGILILLVDPMKALVFAVLILAIQQLDGNIIGPKILGDKTGLDSFAVVFAILISGGMFGIPGMVVGVPVFATIFGILNSICNEKLKKKNLPIEISAYIGKNVVEEIPQKEESTEE